MKTLILGSALAFLFITGCQEQKIVEGTMVDDKLKEVTVIDSPADFYTVTEIKDGSYYAENKENPGGIFFEKDNIVDHQKIHEGDVIQVTYNDEKQPIVDAEF